jgi:hypothetical protein
LRHRADRDDRAGAHAGRALRLTERRARPRGAGALSARRLRCEPSTPRRRCASVQQRLGPSPSMSLQGPRNGAVPAQIHGRSAPKSAGFRVEDAQVRDGYSSFNLTKNSNGGGSGATEVGQPVSRPMRLVSHPPPPRISAAPPG